jgi:hypothetical protein
MHAEPLQSANDRSRWCTARALVEQGTYRIDDARKVPGWDTIDLVRHDGHFYSSKPPLLATIVAGIYWCVRETLGWKLSTHLAETTRLILLVLNVLPWTAALLLFSRLVQRWAARGFTAVFITAAAAFGTLLTPFLMSLNNHVPAAASVIFALCSAVGIVAEGRREWWRFAAVGFWSAFAVANELPAAAFAAALLVLVIRVAPGRTLLCGVGFAIIPLAALLYTNYEATGGFKPFYAAYGTETYEFVHEGVPSYWKNPKGLDKATDPFFVYLLHCTFGHHGIFSLSPIWLLTLAGWCIALWTGIATRRQEKRGESREQRRIDGGTYTQRLVPFHLVGLAVTLVVFAFYMAQTRHYNYGGVSVALRWMLWLAPLWLLSMLPALDAWLKADWGGRTGGSEQNGNSREQTHSRGSLLSALCSLLLSALCALLLAVSVFSAWYPLNGPWKHPWLFTLMEQAGWIDYSDPRPTFPHKVYSWIGRLPEGDAVQDDEWIELSGHNAGGQEVLVRLSDGGPVTIDGRAARTIVIQSRLAGDGEIERRRHLDVEHFGSGKTLPECLLWPEGAPSATERAAAVALLTGLPAPAYYVRAPDVFEKTPLRVDAFRCRRAYAVVEQPGKGSAQRLRFRRDVWFSPELPFGVLRVEATVSDSRGTILSRQRLTASRAGRVPPTAIESDQ